MHAHIYEISQIGSSLTPVTGGKVNIEKLDLEIRASSVNNYTTPPYLYNNKLYVQMSINAHEETESNKNALDAVVFAHDGEFAAVSEVLVKERETKIRQLTEMAIYHPLLDEVQTVEYLTSIDNWFNAWKRSGIDSVLIAKIVEDAGDISHTQNAFLNTVVNPDEGYNAAQFMISIITS